MFLSWHPVGSTSCVKNHIGFGKGYSNRSNHQYSFMLKHTFLLILRNFKRFKGTFLINLVGLSTGLACAMLIYLWVNDELGIDKFFENQDRLFQVMQNTYGANGIETIEATPQILLKTLEDEIPEIEYVVAVIPPGFNVSKGTMTHNDKRLKLSGQYATKEFFNVFSYRLLHGNRDHVLADKNAVVVSRDLALRLFDNTEHAVGKAIEWSAQDINGVFYISGVFETILPAATTRFDIVLNYQLFEEKNPSEGWLNSTPRTYILMKENASFNLLNDKIGGLIQAKDMNAKSTLFIQRYGDRYLYGKYENGVPSGGRIEYVKLFATIAIFILVIACINFMNLSTARASRRIKEVGIKKTIGAKTSTLVFQYLGESLFMVLLSMAIAVLIVDLILVPFGTLTGKNLELTFNTNTIVALAVITSFTALLAGSYPALYLSGFRPAEVLKGSTDTSAIHVWARTGCVIFQFVISVVLIVSVWVVYKQVEFVQGKNLGFERNQVVYFSVEKMSEAFLSEIKGLPGVINAGGGNLETGKQLGGTNGIGWEGKSDDDNTFFNLLWLSYDLMETVGMEMLSGHTFSREFGSPDQIIFNEVAIQSMGLEDPVGKIIHIEGEKKQIRGVVKNFHYESLYQPLKPCALMLAPMEYAPRVSVKIEAGKERSVLASLKMLFERHNPGLIFEFKFMDDDYERLYASEIRVSLLSRYFAGIAVLVSCLGLFGLAAFTIERRTKEIGIRKVLGASPFRIFRLLSADFAKMVLTGIAAGLLISSIAAHLWLENFAYHIELKPSYFLFAGITALLIALLTVSFHAAKGASVNPTEYLRNE